MAIARGPRPDLNAYNQAVRADFPAVARELTNLLGLRLVAYLAGVSETRAVREWIERGREPRGEVEGRLRLALRVALLLRDYDSKEVVRSWMQGLNPQLDDRSPARMIREGDLEEVGAEILAAARAFVDGG